MTDSSVSTSRAGLKPLSVFRYHDGEASPNPWKVVIFLYELDLPWVMEIMDRSDPNIRDKPPIVDISPNGRMPLLVDPNTGIKLWESAAIIEYLLDEYDQEGRLRYTESPQKYEQRTWAYFQMSGQGPYFGQRTWFLFLHHEQLPSAQERYAQEIRRVYQVIDKHLARTGREWLVGDKICYADIMFQPWNEIVSMAAMNDAFMEEWERDMPHAWSWYQRLKALPSAVKAHEFTMAAMAKSKSWSLEGLDSTRKEH